MAAYVEYSCPHCGSLAVIPLLRIEWAEVAPCPSCGQPVRRNQGALATNWMACCMSYSFIILLPLLALSSLGAQDKSSFGLQLFTAFCLAMVGAAVAGIPAYLYGYFLAKFQTTGSADAGVAGPSVCSICGASLRSSERQAGLCSSCRSRSVG